MINLIELDNALMEWADNVISRIRSNMESENINATGATSASLEAVLTPTGVQILGAPYFAERTEIGRTPTKNRQSWDFSGAIKDWIVAKGIESHFGISDDRDLNKVSKAIAMKISREGSSKYRGDRPQTDVYSTVFEEEIQKLDEIVQVSGGEVLEGVLDDFAREIGQAAGMKNL